MRKRAHHNKAMTLDEISKVLGITRERVRQIERDALKKLNARLHARGIKAEYILPENYEEAKA